MIEKAVLVSIGLRRNVGYCLLDWKLLDIDGIAASSRHTAVDGVGLLVRNLNAELFLNGHHYLDSIERVQSEIIREVCLPRNLSGVSCIFVVWPQEWYL